MILLVASEKGGTGKTTLATNIAAIRAAKVGDVLLLDTDRQGSASYWSTTRDQTEGHAPVICVQKFGVIDKDIERLSTRFKDIIIDAGGCDSVELRSAFLVADKIYIPTQASQFDIWAINSIERMFLNAKTFNPDAEAYIIINRASTHSAMRDTEDASEFVKELESFKLSRAVVRERVAFRRAARDGVSVNELKARAFDAKACAEIMDLYKEVYNGQ